MISDEHKSIFIHIPKTGGVSIKYLLSKKYEYEDQEQWIEDVRKKQMFAPIDHLDARESLALYGKEKWDEYFKFAFVRNPWDLAVSLYHWEKMQINSFQKKGEHISTHRMQPRSWEDKDKGLVFRTFNDQSLVASFNEYIDNLLYENQGHTWTQTKFLINRRGNIDLDFIGRFENYEQDAQSVIDKLNIDTEVPHKNKSDHEHYSKYYDEETKKKVEHIFKDDIEYFKYKFESI